MEIEYIFICSSIAPTRIAYGLMDFTARTIPAQNEIIRNKARYYSQVLLECFVLMCKIYVI